MSLLQNESWADIQEAEDEKEQEQSKLDQVDKKQDQSWTEVKPKTIVSCSQCKNEITIPYYKEKSYSRFFPLCEKCAKDNSTKETNNQQMFALKCNLCYKDEKLMMIPVSNDTFMVRCSKCVSPFDPKVKNTKKKTTSKSKNPTIIERKNAFSLLGDQDSFDN